jgi:hypothetical protein
MYVGLHEKVYERRLNRRAELRVHNRIFVATRRMNDHDVLRKFQIILNFKYPDHLNRSRLDLR